MLWRINKKETTSADKSARRDARNALNALGSEVVLFVPHCVTGELCDVACQLEGGRIPLKLAEPTPLAECTNKGGCACRYHKWPPNPSCE